MAALFFTYGFVLWTFYLSFACRDVGLGIRSEHFARQVARGDGADPDMVVFRFGNEEMVARVEPDHAPHPGARIHLTVDMRKACLFDPASEERIGA